MRRHWPFWPGLVPPTTAMPTGNVNMVRLAIIGRLGLRHTLLADRPRLQVAPKQICSDAEPIFLVGKLLIGRVRVVKCAVALDGVRVQNPLRLGVLQHQLHVIKHTGHLDRLLLRSLRRHGCGWL